MAVPSAEWPVHLPGRLPEELFQINCRAPLWQMLTTTLRDKEAIPAFHSIQPSGYGEDRRWLEKDLEGPVKAVCLCG